MIILIIIITTSDKSETNQKQSDEIEKAMNHDWFQYYFPSYV